MSRPSVSNNRPANTKFTYLCTPMRPIKMVDLQSQYQRLQPEIDKALLQAVADGMYIKGPEVGNFEKNLAAYCNVKHVISCANGTDALQIAFMALGLQPGDEVITPAFSYAALAEVLHLLQLQPVFAEVNPNTFLLEPEAIGPLITSKTKAIAPVHLYGQCCNMDKILEIAKAHNLYVVEDTAQAIGATYTFENGETAFAGTMGNIGTTSFFPSKNLGCYGDGGALFTKDESLANKIKMIANHGQKTKYYHDIIGVNSRLDTLQAAILNVKLNHLNEFAQHRNAVANQYNEYLKNLDGIEIPTLQKGSTHVFHQYTLKLKNAELRNNLASFLKDHNIPTMVYYPLPLHKQKAYFQDASFPVSEQLCQVVISLPICSETSEEQIAFILETIKKFILQHS